MSLLRTVALVGVCFTAQASWGAEQGFYFGLNAGQAKYDFAYEGPRPSTPAALFPTPIPSFNPNVRLVPPPVFGGEPAFGVIAQVSPLQAFWIPGTDEKSTAFGGFVGYRIFPYAAIELAYVDLGALHEYQPELITSIFIVPAVTSKLETTGPAVSALGLLPITQRWDVYLRGGMLFADQKVTISSDLLTQRRTYGSDAFLFGAGTQFDFGAHWTVRLDFQRFDSVGEENGIGEADIDVWSLGVLFRL